MLLLRRDLERQDRRLHLDKRDTTWCQRSERHTFIYANLVLQGCAVLLRRRASCSRKLVVEHEEHFSRGANGDAVTVAADATFLSNVRKGKHLYPRRFTRNHRGSSLVNVPVKKDVTVKTCPVCLVSFGTFHVMCVNYSPTSGDLALFSRKEGKKKSRLYF